MEVLSFNEIQKISNGEVTTPDSYNYRTLRPEENGLYSEKIFGPFKAQSNKNLYDDRKTYWGHIKLATAIVHPLMTNECVEAILVIPPFYRNFLMKEPQSILDDFKSRKAWLAANEATLCDPPDKILLEEFGATEESNLYLGSADNPICQEPMVNIGYRTLLNTSNKLKRLIEVGAPVSTLEEFKNKLQTNFNSLIQIINVDHLVELSKPELLRASGLSETQL